MDHQTKKLLSKVLLTLALIALVRSSSSAKDDSRLLFRQDLSTYGYSFHYAKSDNLVHSFTDLAFLSDDLLLLSVREVHLQELHPKILQGGTLQYDNPMRAQTPADLLSTLRLFNVEQKRLVRTEKLPVRKLKDSVQAAGMGRFLMLGSNGLQLCSADFHCGSAWPAEAPFYVSPRGDRIVTGSHFTEQQLLYSNTFSIVRRFPPRSPKVMPGDIGVLLQDSAAELQMPGEASFHLDLRSSYLFPQARFIDERTVIGVRMRGVKDAEAVAIKADGTELYHIQLKDWWRTQFFTSVSGSRFGIVEQYQTRLNQVSHFPNTGEEPPNRTRIRVFDLAGGKRVFETEWNPGDYRGTDIMPALSPDGHRLALVQKGELRVYEIP